jgi:hypothetical protein
MQFYLKICTITIFPTTAFTLFSSSSEWLAVFKAQLSVPFTYTAELKLSLNWAKRSTKREW